MRISFLIFLLCSMCLQAQNENGKWYFGNHAALDLMTTPPAPLVSSALNSDAACATVSDASGNLLFYTDGLTVYNQAHAVMANGTGLGATTNTNTAGLGNQYAAIVKPPGNPNLYYIFSNTTSGGVDGLYCTTVDMSLSAGMGSVTVKNVLISGAMHTGQLATAQHCNGRDTWVIIHDYNGVNFKAFLVSAAGVSTSPVLSAAGYMGTIYSYLKVSRNGKKIATQYNGSSLTVFDFNSATGVISNSLSLVTGNSIPYGSLDFSPDGSKLYCVLWLGGFLGRQLSQWDLCAGQATAIIASQYTMSASYATDVQLAQDNKIYVGRQGQSTIGVVNNPNAPGAACNYVNTGLPITPGICTSGLPHYVYIPKPGPTFTYSLSCQSASFTNTLAAAIVTVMNQCAAPSYSPVPFLWNFGDPLSGNTNTSTAQAPTHQYSAPGTYTANLILYYPCYTDTLKQVITITTPSPTFAVSGNFSICPGSSTTLTASGANSYTWSHGATGPSVVLSPVSTSTYAIHASNTSGCVPSAVMLTVTVFPSSLSIVSPIAICPGQSTTLSATGMTSYTWSTGSTSSSSIVSPTATTVYSLTGTDSYGCVLSDVAGVLVHSVSPLVLSGHGTVCKGKPVTLAASGASTYTWSNGATTQTTSVQPLVITRYTVSGTGSFGCIGTATLFVDPVPAPVLNVSGNFSVCAGDPVMLSVSGASTFTWSTGGHADTISIRPAVPTVYTVSGTDKNGCVGMLQVTVNATAKQDLSVSPDVTITPGASATLSVHGATNYAWTGGSETLCTHCSSLTVSPQKTTRYCVTAGDACISKACVNVEVSCYSGDLSMPNAFTPNNDGLNDVFCLQGWTSCITRFTVLVFNRWGEKVYESLDPSFCWDGIHKGKPLDADVFVFTVSASFSDGGEINKRGTITLLR